MPNRPKQSRSDGDTTINGKTLQQWDEEWVRLDGGFATPHPTLRHVVGLFRAVLSREVMYVGQGTEHRNGGLAKRLADFRRKSPSARQHWGAQQIRKHIRDLTLEVLQTGSDKSASDTAKQLKAAMLVRRRPPWNVQASPKSARRS